MIKHKESFTIAEIKQDILTVGIVQQSFQCQFCALDLYISTPGMH